MDGCWHPSLRQVCGKELRLLLFFTTQCASTFVKHLPRSPQQWESACYRHFTGKEMRLRETSPRLRLYADGAFLLQSLCPVP